MKPNKTLFGAFAISTMLTIGACQQTELSDCAPAAFAPAAVAEFVADDAELSAGDAAAVARIFRNGNRPTRAGSGAVVRNVVTISDAAGRPALYAVNLQEGYLLVSATKRCYPVLAQIDCGSFSLDREPSGLDVVLQEMIETVEAARDSAVVFDCRPAWLPYEERTRPERVQTRMTDDEFCDIQNEWYGKWYAEGADTHRLATKPDEMPEDVYQRFCETAIGDDAWVDTPYNCMESGVITVKYHDDADKIGPLLSTTWDQGSPYNSQVSGKKRLGCVTVAVGQLMRYYQRPASFNWSDMPNATSYENVTLSSFLNQLRGELHVTDDGASNIDNAQRVLRSYGYNCSIHNHNESTLYSNLAKNRPAYTRGTDTNGDGHAWVADGSKSSHPYTEYKLYALNNGLPRPWYVELDSERVYHQSIFTLHMNWGWGGKQNGWFIDSQIGLYADIGFTSQRKDLIINGY